ncbi:hypothetical protein BMS3Abin04_00429 [bacterium BMS3Abin04]|nr:hypothetical protein BMS3Abin04_00429 [bacterium BMS3Abin04]
MSHSFASKAVNYFLDLSLPKKPPEDISFMNPYSGKETQEIIKRFFQKYFSDTKKRIFIFGINPGRFGGGITGVSFTDPVALREQCKIDNNFGYRKELSSEFVYKVIDKYGGAEKFYSHYFLTALYPLAIIKNSKNYNYYDDSELLSFMKPLLVESIKAQIQLGADSRFAVSFGKKNAKFLQQINSELKIFDKIKILDHPRYIMQYKRKKLDEYIDNYLDILS